MLSNAYFLAKFRFDTAENEPGKNLQKFAKTIANFKSRTEVLATAKESEREALDDVASNATAVFHQG